MAAEFGVDMEQVRAFLRGKSERRNKMLDERYEQATQEFRRIVAGIVREVNPVRIYQWGSLLDRRRFSEISDIDIAIEGAGGPEAFFRAVGIAMDCASFPVDVVEMEKLPAGTAQRIRTRGRIVYERSGS